MSNPTVIPLLSNPGIQRDGTQFDSKAYIDGQWCRFYMGRPRKIGGYKLISQGNLEITRTLFNVPQASTVDTYFGRASNLSFINYDFKGNATTQEIFRTPKLFDPLNPELGGFVPNPNNLWSMSTFTNSDTPEGNIVIVAQVSPTANDVNSTLEGGVFYGDINSTNALVPIMFDGSPLKVSGGIINIGPYLMAYGNFGYLYWSNEGNITDWSGKSGENNSYTSIASSKVITMKVARGSTTPQALAWTASTLINVTFDGAAGADATFSSTVVQDNITIISANCVVEYDQQFYWIGIDQFYFYNGIVTKLLNDMSSDYFFDNVNLGSRSKIWGMAVPRFKEIWWHYPRGNATECSDVLIYNVQLNVWYDSVLGRSCGISANTFPLPIMADSNSIETQTPLAPPLNVQNLYGLWMHEYNYDRIQGAGLPFAILSYFETAIMTMFDSDPNSNILMRTRRIEPDFVQDGLITVTVNNRMFPSATIDNGGIIQTGPFSFDSNTLKIDDVRSQGRLVSYVFSSNVSGDGTDNDPGGFYQLGKTLLNYEAGDVRP